MASAPSARCGEKDSVLAEADNHLGSALAKSYSVRMQLNRSLIKSTIVAALGGLLFGFDTAVISGTAARLTEAYEPSPRLPGATVASAIVGTIVGAMLAGFPGDRLGRGDS
jgi:hypothetical protein